MTPGYGPTQYLGAFDCRPELPTYQAAAIRSLKPVPAPGGATLRWAMPRPYATTNNDGVSWLQGPGAYACCLTLYVASFDLLPVGRQWRSDEELPLPGYDDCPWPGRMASNDATGNDAIAVDFTAMQQWGAGGTDVVLQDDAQRYLGRNLGKPALDLLPYAARSGWGEADLLELGGGARYVAAWLKFHYVRHDQGADQFANAQYYMPWTITAGRAVAPGHRNWWCNGYVLTPVPNASVFDANNPRYHIAAPFAPTMWVVDGGTNSNNGADSDVELGIEFRGSAVFQRQAISILTGNYPGSIFSVAIGGSLNLIPTYNGASVGVVLVAVQALR